MNNKTMRGTFIDKCKQILSRDDIKEELHILLRPLLDYIINIISPYLYLSLILVTISFLLILGIFVLLLRKIP